MVGLVLLSFHHTAELLLAGLFLLHGRVRQVHGRVRHVLEDSHHVLHRLVSPLVHLQGYGEYLRWGEIQFVLGRAANSYGLKLRFGKV